MTGDIRNAMLHAARNLGVSPVDLATIVSYETAGTFDPVKRGPTTKWGTHRGLIQWGEPQAQKYLGGDFSIPKQADGIVSYMRDAGVKPGMGMLDLYSAVNAGQVGRYNASDTAAGGAPGTVRDKVENQMGGHRKKAEALMGQASISPEAQSFVDNNPQPGGYGPGINDPNAQPNWGNPQQGSTQSPFGSMAPLPDHVLQGSVTPPPEEVAPGDRISAALSAFGQQNAMRAPPPGNVSGPSEGQANALANVLNSPTAADALLKRRLGFMLGGR